VDKDLAFVSDRLRDVGTATNFRVKIGEIGLLTYRTFVALAFRNGVEYHNSDFKRITVDDRGKIRELWSKPSEFKRLKGVHPSSITSLATFAWRRHCQTLRDDY